jgi:hypothetical protein
VLAMGFLCEELDDPACATPFSPLSNKDMIEAFVSC